MTHICVFCGANTGTDPHFSEAAHELGNYLATNNLTLVYGGGNVGLMGVVADATLEANGNVLGFIPEFLSAWEVGHTQLTEMTVTQTMHERKALMADRSDAVVVLPGGYGTLDELFEMLTWAQLRLHQKPICLLNINGFYDPLLLMVDNLVKTGFIHPDNRSLLLSATTVSGVFTEINGYQPVVSSGEWKK